MAEAPAVALPAVPVRPLGKLGMVSSGQGLGCMGMSMFYGTKGKPDADNIAVIRRAIELGVTMFDTMDLYGPYTNEILVGKAIRDLREKVQVCTKYGPMAKDGKFTHSATPEYTRESCAGSLERLGVDAIDLYYLRTPDTNTPIETTFAELKKLVDEGKIKYVGVSEFTADEIRRAHAVCPITACQLEWSLWCRDVEQDIVPTCRELGIGIVPYSPLGHGFFTGAVTSLEELKDDDVRKHVPRFQALEANRKFFHNLKALADKKGVTPGQLALAWVHAQGDDVFPIPGTTTISHLEENIGALGVELTKEEMEGLAAAVPHLEVEGSRQSPAAEHLSYEGRMKAQNV